MPVVEVEDLTFRFPAGFTASKLDDWAYYTKRFQNVANTVRVPCGKCGAELRCRECGTNKVAGVKAGDVLAVAGPVAWLVEVKDYSRDRRTKVIDLADEVALKVRDTLALLVAAGMAATDPDEKQQARRALGCTSLRVVLHLEQPAKPSKLVGPVVDRDAIRLKLRKLLKAADPRALVLDRGDAGHVPWTVERQPRDAS